MELTAQQPVFRSADPGAKVAEKADTRVLTPVRRLRLGGRRRGDERLHRVGNGNARKKESVPVGISVRSEILAGYVDLA